MNDRQILRATQSPRGTDKLRLTWAIPGETLAYEYLVSATDLNQCVNSCRNALNDLVKVMEATSDDDLQRALRRLALKGTELYETMMPDAGDKPRGARAFRQWFEGTVASADKEAWRVEFVYQDDQPVIPWGLTFPPSAYGTVRGTSFDDYIDFWAHRYLTVSYPSGARGDLHPGEEEALDGQNFQFSMLIEREPSGVELDSTSINKDEDLEIRIRGRLNDQLISKVSKLTEVFSMKRRWNHVVYLSLQSEGDAYPLSDNEKLTADDLKRICDVLIGDGGGRAIALLDRDAIIRGDRGRAWRSTFFSDEWAGLIAVETDVVPRKLWYQGFRFLTELLSQKVPLSQSLLEIRKALWPYSLLYGVYSNPDRVFFKPPPAIVAEMRQILEGTKGGQGI